MKTLSIPVQFTGSVEVSVPDRLSDKDARRLAEKLALAQIVATTDNPDAPEEDAFDEYKDQCSPKARPNAEEDWDASVADGVNGTWKLGE